MDAITDYPLGISTIDTGHQRKDMVASHLLVRDDAVAFIDVGASGNIPRLLSVLDAKGIAKEDVTHIIVTHVHLDHAGGAGLLMDHCPNAALVVHPRGARHMHDPSQLVAGATAVYGEEVFRQQYGEIVPIAKSRIIEKADNEVLDFGAHQLRFLDTPGHAKHHFCIYDALSESVFTGDTFGVSYPELMTPTGPFIFPTTTPIQFDPEALKHSIRRLAGLRPQAMYLTHFGQVTQVARLADELINLIDVFVSLAEELQTSDDRTNLLQSHMKQCLYQAYQQQSGQLSPAGFDEIVGFDVMLNVQGIEWWLAHR